EGPFALFFADGIGRNQHSQDQTINEGEGAKGAKNLLRAISGIACAAEGHPKPGDENNGDEGCCESAPVQPRVSCGDSQFTLHNWQKSHALKRSCFSLSQTFADASTGFGPVKRGKITRSVLVFFARGKRRVPGLTFGFMVMRNGKI